MTIEMRAAIACTTAIIGVETSVSQSVEKPVVAPATEYVEMPEGSSSAAPVINPGPRFLTNPTIGRNARRDKALYDTRFPRRANES